jgi:hypothetical protein
MKYIIKRHLERYKEGEITESKMIEEIEADLLNYYKEVLRLDAESFASFCLENPDLLTKNNSMMGINWGAVYDKYLNRYKT